MRKVVFAIAMLSAAATAGPSSAEIVLSGTQFFQNFDDVGSGLANGVTVNAGATASSLGTAATLNTTATTWGTSTGQFANYASVTGLTSSALTSAQTAATDRALGVRQTGTFGDPGAAFEFQIHHTLGFKDFTLSFQSEMASVQGRSTTWNVKWALDSLPTSFNLLGQITDPGTFGEAPNSYTLPVAVNDQALTLWLRVAALSTAS